jgi:hypothetical protein
MSHLSILPTVLRDADLLAASLTGLGFRPRWGGELQGFADDRQAVDLQVRLPDGQPLGWRRQSDGSLALVGDLQRLGQSGSLQRLIGRITRAYAARQALADAAALPAVLPGALIEVHG